MTSTIPTGVKGLKRSWMGRACGSTVAGRAARPPFVPGGAEPGGVEVTGVTGVDRDQMVLVPVAGSGSHRLRRVLDDLGDAPLCSHPWPAAVQTEVMLRLCWVLGVCGWCLRHGVLSCS